MTDDEEEYGSEERLTGTEETEVECPFCGEAFTIVVDQSVDHQSYIEDCFVCCRPIRFEVVCEDGALVSVSADRG
jgi:hypothetical protein